MTFVHLGARKTIQAQRLNDDDDEGFIKDGVRIKAAVSDDELECAFTVNQPLLPELGWWFSNQEAAQGSPLAEAIFELDDIESVLITHNVMTVRRGYLCIDEWKPSAEKIGAIIRDQLNSEGPLISSEIIDSIPSDDVIRADVERVLNEVLNPGVASHGGVISLVDVKGNNVWVNMGGGCQGCSAAAVTLRQGVEGELRKNVPFLGAIHDATDHAAGTNPYMS